LRRRSTWVALIIGGLLAASLLASAPSRAATGAFTEYTDQALPYLVYVPSSYTGNTDLPLVVYLHGCEQTTPDVAVGTGWNQEAEAAGFLVVFPQQVPGLGAPATTGNDSNCWNFYDPTAGRTSGETADIAAITREVMQKWRVDPSRVYVIGASAGAAMAVDMSVYFPDMYAAVGVVSGCPSPTAATPPGPSPTGPW